MTEWHTIPAKFSSEEKKILDILRDVYGLNYNQSLKAGIEFLARFLAIGEYYAMADGDIIKKINRSGKKHMKHLDDDVKKILKKVPIEKQEAEYEKFSTGANKIISNLDKVFVKNRKRGRKKLPRKRGRSSIR
ncbi:MAG TPA: hypothetical protein VJJ01_02570 [Nitrosopumilaceae archaeon]|nr:hypothetical protein [Nitrosopumilaceae archaeon]